MGLAVGRAVVLVVLIHALCKTSIGDNAISEASKAYYTIKVSRSPK